MCGYDDKLIWFVSLFQSLFSPKWELEDKQAFHTSGRFWKSPLDADAPIFLFYHLTVELLQQDLTGLRTSVSQPQRTRPHYHTLLSAHSSMLMPHTQGERYVQSPESLLKTKPWSDRPVWVIQRDRNDAKANDIKKRDVHKKKDITSKLFFFFMKLV